MARNLDTSQKSFEATVEASWKLFDIYSSLSRWLYLKFFHIKHTFCTQSYHEKCVNCELLLPLDERGDGAVANFEKKSRTVGFTNWAHLGRDCFAKIAISSQAKSKKKRNNFGYLCAIKISDKRNSCTSHISLRVI